ncbi:MAG: PAS domain-containing protein, partial [Deltaproteobacteria bacterium]|nr:PAS domain-containing protein [Deltaproteobacteria bacterium]
MSWQFSFYLIPLIAGAAVTFGLAFSGWRRRHVPGAYAFVVLMLAVTLWSLAYAVEIMSADLQHMVFWASFKYFGIVLVPASWLALSIQYTGRESWLTRRNLSLLAIEPLAVILLVWTNDYHGMIWSHVALKSTGLLTVRAVSYGPLFIVHALYSYLLLLLGTVVIFQILNREPRLYRGQGIAAFTAILAPWAGNIIHVFHISPFGYLDPTPFTFSIVGLAVIFGFLRFRLLDIVPVARDVVIQSMTDIVVILDSGDRVVEINPAAQEAIGRTIESSIGQPAAEVLSRWPELMGRFRNVADAHSEISSGDGPEERFYDLRISPLYGRQDHITGRLLVLRDITEVKRVQKAMQYRLAFENIVMSISTNFINIGPLEIDGEINRALQTIGEFADMDRAYVFLFSENGQLMDNTHEWCRPGIEPQISKLKGLPVEGFPWWMKKIRHLENIHIPRISDLPSEAAAEKDILQSQEILSLIVVPLAYSGLPIGYLGADSVKMEKVWSEDIINLLRIVGEIFVNALERKRVVLILQGAHDELEQRVRERTLELMSINQKLHKEIEERQRTQEEKVALEEQLLQSQKLEAIGQLAGGIAHDFNNLLTVISGYSDISLERMQDNDPLRDNIEEIRKASARATELTQQLLAFSRRQILDMRVLNLNTVLQNIGQMLPRIIGEDIELIMNLAEDLGNVKTDPGQIEQVVLNLAVNARDAMPEGGKLLVETNN